MGWLSWDENNDSQRDGDPPCDGDQPGEGDFPRDADHQKICLATFHELAWPHFILLLSTKPLYKLTGTGRPED